MLKIFKRSFNRKIKEMNFLWMFLLMAPFMGFVCPATMCHNVDERMKIPCLCDSDRTGAVAVNCDNLVFKDNFPQLPSSVNIVEYRQRHSGLQDLTSQIFGDSELPLKKVDFSRNEIGALNGRVFEGLEETLEVLLLEHNKISDVYSQGLSLPEVAKLTSLKTLNLGHNEIRRIDKSLLGKLSQLQVLHLHGNLLRELPTSAMMGLRTLKVLTLQENDLYEIPIDGFSTTPQLVFLNVSQNRISFVQNGAFRGLINLTALDLSYNRLNELTTDVFKGLDNLEVLDLSSNFFQDVPADSLKDLLFLKSLILKNNQIQNLGGIVALGPASTLKILDLTRNHIVNLESNTFRRLTGLETLKMSINSVGERNDDTFEGLNMLKKLELGDLKFFSFPTRMISKTRALKYLNLDHNRIRVITSRNLRPISKIIKLSIADNIIQEIPDDLFRNFTRLTSLNLYGNNIASIPEVAFTPIRNNLMELDLGFNVLRYLPTFNLPLLSKLTLSGNKITTMPEDAFTYLPKLQFLHLSENRLSSLSPSAFLPLSRLESLDLSFNRLTGIEDGQFNGTVINFINLKNNRIKKLSEKSFKNLLFMTSLDLSNNKIDTIEEGTFHDVTFLHILDLSNNKLTSFKKGYFNLPRTPTTHLRYLDLSNNDITYLPNNALAAHPRLIWLSLSGNRLSFFPSSVLEHHVEMSQLNLSSNFIENIGDLDFAKSRSLTELDLSRNKIREVSERAFQGSAQLQELNLSDNEIMNLYPDTFLGIARLKLDLSSNKLSKLPSTIFELPKLKLVSLNLAYNKFNLVPVKALRPQNSIFNDLNMAHNNVSDIPKKDDAVINMKSIDLSYNPLTPLDTLELLNEPKLIRNLNLAGTNINQVPIIEARFLTSLNLSDNNIDEISDKTVNLTRNLQSLDLSHNEIPNVKDALSSAWHYLPNLHYLDISHNPLAFITNGDFDGLTQLETLHASHLNELSRVERSAFDELSLKELYMYDLPKIDHIDARGILDNMRGLEKVDIELTSPVVDDDLHGVFSPRLERLAIRGTKVKKITSSAFLNMNSPKMELGIIGTNITSLDERMLFLVPMSSEITLFVNDSQIKTLSRRFLEDVIVPRQEHLNLVGLETNPLYCDCNMKELKNWIEEKKGSLFETARCAGPSILRGKRISDLVLSQFVCDERPREKNNRDDIITKDELEEMHKVKEKPKDSEWLTLSSMDTIIISVVGGVILFVLFIIIILCLTRFCCQSGRRANMHPFHVSGNCTCVKPPLPSVGYTGPYVVSPGSRAGTLKSMPSTTPVSPSYGTLGAQSRASHYSGPPSYLGLYPHEEHDYR